MKKDEPVLEIETRDRVRVLRLNRPERKNALSSELGWSIVDAVEQAARDEEVRVARRGLASEDGREAVAAILEKRKPEFRGR